MKKKLSKIVILFSSFVLILSISIFPSLALTVDIDIQYLGAEGLSTGLYFKTSQAVDYTLYSEGSSIAATSEFNASAYISLSTIGLNAGYTGFLLYLTENPIFQRSQNLVPSILQPDHITALADGTFYIEDSSVFYFYKNTGHLYLSAVPINLQNYLANQQQNQYDLGLEDGIASQQGRINELESTISVLQNQQTSQAQAYNRGLIDGTANASDTNHYIQNVATTIVDGTGSIFQQMFQLEVLGIKLYQVALLCCMVPLILFFVRVCLRH